MFLFINHIQRAILRNPVLNPVTMATASDMATWMRVLAGCVPSRGGVKGGDGYGDGGDDDDVNGNDLYDGEELQRLQSLSWVPYADKVSTPLRFILGGRDTRVLNQQTFELCRHLRPGLSKWDCEG